MTDKPITLKVCHGQACMRNLSPYSLERAKNDKEMLKLDHVQCEECSCLGRCEKGPNAVIEQDGRKDVYTHMTPVEIGRVMQNIKNHKRK